MPFFLVLINMPEIQVTVLTSQYIYYLTLLYLYIILKGNSTPKLLLLLCKVYKKSSPSVLLFLHCKKLKESCGQKSYLYCPSLRSNRALSSWSC